MLDAGTCRGATHALPRLRAPASSAARRVAFVGPPPPPPPLHNTQSRPPLPVALSRGGGDAPFAWSREEWARGYLTVPPAAEVLDCEVTEVEGVIPAELEVWKRSFRSVVASPLILPRLCAGNAAAQRSRVLRGAACSFQVRSTTSESSSRLPTIGRDGPFRASV